MEEHRPGRLIIISGPSGAGKSTVVKQLLASCPLPLQLSVSATTRPPRPGEVDGREYCFMSAEMFQKLRAEHAFLECKEVFGRGHWYGTPCSQVTTGLQAGRWVILEIDVEGAAVVAQSGLAPIMIFLHPGGMDELERRLRARGTESSEAIARRLEVARREMEAIPKYHHEVINRDVGETVEEICEILQRYNKEDSSCLKN
jgi:guanylate kinase